MLGVMNSRVPTAHEASKCPKPPTGTSLPSAASSTMPTSTAAKPSNKPKSNPLSKPTWPGEREREPEEIWEE